MRLVNIDYNPLRRSQQAQQISGYAEFNRRSSEIQKRQLDLNQDMLDFNKRMNAVQTALSLTKSAAELGQAVYAHKQNKAYAEVERDVKYRNQQIQLGADKHNPYELDEKGIPKGWGSYKTQDGRTIDEIDAKIAQAFSKENGIFKTDYFRNKALSNLERKYVDGELKAEIAVYQRMKTEEAAMQQNRLTDVANEFNEGLISDTGEPDLNRLEAAKAGFAEADGRFAAAQKDYDSSPAVSEEVEARFNNAKKAAFGTTYKDRFEAKEALDKAEAEAVSAQKEYDKASKRNDESKIAAAEEALAKASENYDIAKTRYDKANANYEAAQTEYSEAETAYNTSSEESKVDKERRRTSLMEAGQTKAAAQAKLEEANLPRNSDLERRVREDISTLGKPEAQIDLEVKAALKEIREGKVQYDATTLASNQQYTKAREMVEQARKDGKVSAEAKEAILKKITEIQRDKNRNTWGNAMNEVLGKGNPWRMLEECRNQELRFREGGPLDEFYEGREDDQADHHKSFVKLIEELEDVIRVRTERAERGKENRQEDLYNDGEKYLQMLKMGEDTDRKNYTHKDFDRDMWSLVNSGLEMKYFKKLEEQANEYLPPYMKDVLLPQFNAALEPLEKDGPDEEAWKVRQLWNDAARSGTLTKEMNEEFIKMLSAKVAGRAGRRDTNAGAFTNAEATVQDQYGRTTDISVRHEERNDQRTSSQSILETNTKNTTWKVGEGSRTDGTFILTDDITKERLTARVSTSGKPEVMVDGKWQSFEEHKEKGIVRRMEQIYNELTPDQKQKIDRLRIHGPQNVGHRQTAEAAHRAELRNILGENVIHREWWEEFANREVNRRRPQNTNPRSNPNARGAR